MTSTSNDTLEDDCNPEQKLINSLGVQITFYIVYTIIFICGVFGNLLVGIVVCKNRNMQNVTNLFILNLAFSDVVMSLFAVPFTPLQTFTGKECDPHSVTHTM